MTSSLERNARRHQLSLRAGERAGMLSAIEGYFEVCKWRISQGPSAQSDSFGARLRLKEDLLREKARDAQEREQRRFDASLDQRGHERGVFMRPVYARPRHSSTTAPRDPS